MKLELNIIPLLVLLWVSVSKSDNFDPVSLSDQHLWEPGINRHSNRLHGGCLNNRDNSQRNFTLLQRNLEDLKIPGSFDGREHWPNCPSLQEIRDQASCGSCWAFGSVEAMTDRICIHSNGKVNFHFSADDLVSCCTYCGGCNSGSIIKAYDYWVNYGIVSGGAYDSHEGCRPYEIPHADDNIILPTPKCVKKCESSYRTPYQKDLHFGKQFYKLPNNVEQIQAEIMLNGPVTASFVVYEDYMFNYTGKGIYYHKFGLPLEGHAVKLIGWGIENGVDYWIAANSWGTGYGDGGFFKFIRGQDDCSIEDDVWGGIPAYP